MSVLGYEIALARPEHLAAIPALERAAAAAFSQADLPAHLRDDVTTDAELAAALRDGRLWVAVAPAGDPVGYAIALWLGSDLHLDEIDVHPAHQRRGVGRALIEAVRAWAHARGAARLTLTTFRFVAWNMPWYERLGFRPLERSGLSPELALVFEAEIATGLPRERRVAMALELDP